MLYLTKKSPDRTILSTEKALYIDTDGLLKSKDDAGVVTIYSASAAETNKAGVVHNSSFVGSPRKATVTFVTSMATPYSINVTGRDVRVWSIENPTSAGFDINSNATLGLTGDVFWELQQQGEF